MSAALAPESVHECKVTAQIRYLAVIAMLAVVWSAASPAWCKSKQSLWAADAEAGRVVELPPPALKRSGMPTPVVLDSSSLHLVTGVAFDKSNNLWVSTFVDNVLEFTPAQLQNLGTVSNPAAQASIGSADFLALDGCAFDSSGDLWIVDFNGGAVHELTQAQLNAGSNPSITPAITITSASLSDPQFDVFDGSGNLWISSSNNSEIIQFSLSQLGSGGSKTPAVVLSNNGGSLDFPAEMAFDKKGNLWVANTGNGTAVMFAKSQLAASGSPTPKVTLSGAAFDHPFGLAFDSRRNLWVVNAAAGDQISKVSSKQTKKNGTPAPRVAITGVVSDPNQMIFGPVF